MSVGNLKDQGNQGKNFTWQFGMLKGLGKIVNALLDINTLISTYGATKVEEPVASLTYALGAADTVINPATTLGWISTYDADVAVIEVVNTSAGGTSIRYNLYETFTFASRAQRKQLSEGDVLRLVSKAQLLAFNFSDELIMSGGYVNFTLYKTT